MGLRIHRARTLETAMQEGIPVTTPERTILDLVATLQRRPLERLLDQARSRRAFDDDRHRDATLLRAGYRTLRVTDTQLEYAPHDVAATLNAVLGADRRAA